MSWRTLIVDDRTAYWRPGPDKALRGAYMVFLRLMYVRSFGAMCSTQHMKNGATHLHREADGGGKHDLVLLTATLFCRFGMAGARSKKEKFAAAPVSLDVCHCFGHSLALALFLVSCLIYVGGKSGRGRWKVRITKNKLLSSLWLRHMEKRRLLVSAIVYDSARSARFPTFVGLGV